jgi:hypothetical protein
MTVVTSDVTWDCQIVAVTVTSCDLGRRDISVCPWPWLSDHDTSNCQITAVTVVTSDYRLTTRYYGTWSGTYHRQRNNINQRRYVMSLPGNDRGCLDKASSQKAARLFFVTPDSVTIQVKSACEGLSALYEPTLCFTWEVKEIRRGYMVCMAWEITGLDRCFSCTSVHAGETSSYCHVVIQF